MTKYEMDPDGVLQGINQFRDAGETFGKEWETRKNALNSGLSGIGSDPISQAFRSRYTPLADKLMSDADGISGYFRNLCDDAQFCVDDYNAANASGASTMNRVAGSGMGDAPTQSQ